MDDFLSNNEDARKEAIKQLKEKYDSNPTELIGEIPKLLQSVSKSEDPFVSLQIVSTVSDLLTAYPNEVDTNFNDIIETLNNLASYDLADDQDLLTGTTVKLLTPIQNSLKIEQKLVAAFPTLVKLMGKQSSVKWSAYLPIANVLMTNPTIAADFAEDLLDVIEQFPQLLMILPNLYTAKPKAFRSKMSILMNIHKSHPDQQSSIIRIIGDISKDDNTLVIPYLSDILPGLNSPMVSYQTMSILSNIASTDPLQVYPHIESIKQGVVIQPATMIEGANTLSLIARVSDNHAIEILPILFDWLNRADQTTLPLVLAEIRNIADMNKDLLTTYIEMVRKHADSPQEAIRDQAIMIIDLFEGRDIHSLAVQIDEQNKKISDIVHSLDDLRDYVDDNIDMMKDFIAEIAKKLPIPITFSTEGKIRKTLLLHFVCHTQTDRCLYPEDRAFTSETKIINRWLKIAFSAVKLGKAVILPPSAGDAVKAVKEAYDSYKDKKEDDFLDFIKQPFLTSSEQDSLINQLREANFFNVFVYDARYTDWNCIMCKSN
ncbi:MAG: hypothetical protein ACW99A_04615 [Candidatus Kariarchaeaceae archaeon]